MRVQCLVFPGGRNWRRFLGVEEGRKEGGGGYSRLLSPFHLQVPLCFPGPSAGVLAPLRTSTSSSSSSSRDIHLDGMLPSDARTGAAARSQGSEGPAVPSRVITQAAVSRNPKQVHILLLGVPRSVSPRPRLPELQGEDHTFTANSLPPPGGGGGGLS